MKQSPPPDFDMRLSLKLEQRTALRIGMLTLQVERETVLREEAEARADAAETKIKPPKGMK